MSDYQWVNPFQPNLYQDNSYMYSPSINYPNWMNQNSCWNWTSTPSFNYSLGWNGSVPVFTSGSSSLSSSNKPLTYDEMIEQEKAKAAKKKELLQAQKEINAAKAEIATAESQVKGFETDKEGNYTKEKKLKDATFGEISKTVLSGVFNGSMKLFEAFVPKKEDGKTDWGKAALRIGGAALAFGATFIPVVGPFVSAVLLTAGVVSGGTLVRKGLVKGYKCITDDNATLTDLKQTTEDITEGGVIVASSIAGIKSMRNSAGVSLKNIKWSDFKNTNWSEVSAAVKMKNNDIAVISKMKSMGATNTKAILGRYKGNIRKVVRSTSKKSEFEKKRNDVLESYNNKQNEILNNLPTDPKARAFEELRFEQYSKIQHELETSSNRISWQKLSKNESSLSDLANLLKQYKEDFLSGKPVKIAGQTFNKGVDDEVFLSKVANIESEFIKAPWYKILPLLKKWTNPNYENNVSTIVNELAKSKNSVMKDMALRNLIPGSGKHFQGDLNSYIPGASALKSLLLTLKPNSFGGWLKTLLWDAPMVPFYATQSLCRSAAGVGYEWETALAPTYHDGIEELFGGLKQKYSKEEYEQAVAQLTTAKTAIEQEQAEVTRQLKTLEA